MRNEGLAHWKKISGYHRRSVAETAIYRFKQLMTGQISLRTYNGQAGAVMVYVSEEQPLGCLSGSAKCSGYLGLGKLRSYS
ncbi:hypothetical protein KLNKPBOH_03326 [Aeromonas veronii]